MSTETEEAVYEASVIVLGIGARELDHLGVAVMDREFKRTFVFQRVPGKALEHH